MIVLLELHLFRQEAQLNCHIRLVMAAPDALSANVIALNNIILCTAIN